MIVICQNDFPIGVLPGATEEQAEAFIKKMRADSDAAITDPHQARPAFRWHDVPEMKVCEQQAEARGEVKVGDRVRAIRDGSAYYRKGDCGTVLSIDRDGDFWVRWDNPIVPDAGYGWFIYQHNCERITQQPATADDAAVGAAEEMVLDAIERRESSAPVGAEASYHPCTSILIEGLKRLEGGSDVLAEWDRARAKADAVLAQQPAAVDGVKVPRELINNLLAALQGRRGDLHFQLAALAAQQPAAVDEAMVERAAAAVMSAPPGISVEAYVRIVLEAALATKRKELTT